MDSVIPWNRSKRFPWGTVLTVETPIDGQKDSHGGYGKNRIQCIETQGIEYLKNTRAMNAAMTELGNSVAE